MSVAVVVVVSASVGDDWGPLTVVCGGGCGEGIRESHAIGQLGQC